MTEEGRKKENGKSVMSEEGRKKGKLEKNDV